MLLGAGILLTIWCGGIMAITTPFNQGPVPTTGVIIVLVIAALWTLLIGWALHKMLKSTRNREASIPLHSTLDCPQRGYPFGSTSRTTARDVGASFGLFGGGSGVGHYHCKDCGGSWASPAMSIPNHP